MCLSSPKMPSAAPAPPPPPPAPEVTQGAVDVNPALAAEQRLAARLGTKQLVVPFEPLNVPQ